MLTDPTQFLLSIVAAIARAAGSWTLLPAIKEIGRLNQKSIVSHAHCRLCAGITGLKELNRLDQVKAIMRTALLARGLQEHGSLTRFQRAVLMVVAPRLARRPRSLRDKKGFERLSTGSRNAESSDEEKHTFAGVSS